MHSGKIMRSMGGLNKKIIWRINTELIKKQYDKQMRKTSLDRSKMMNQYPKTFQQKMMILNDPKTIQVLQVVEFGAKYKEGKNWVIFVLIAIGLFGYLMQKTVPIRINDRYFMISPETSHYYVGYLFAAFNYSKSIFLYLPAMFGIYRLSRFMSISQMGSLVAINAVFGGILGQYLVNQRVKQYEVWETERICFGQGNMLSLLFSFWAMLGLVDGMNHLKARIFLKTVPGLGITRKGLPIGYLGIFYAIIEGYLAYYGKKNSEVVLAQAITGVVFGLVLRRFKPILK